MLLLLRLRLLRLLLQLLLDALDIQLVGFKNALKLHLH